MKINIKKIISELKLSNIDIIFNSLNDFSISGVNTLLKSQITEVSFFHNIKYINDLVNTSASACFITNEYINNLPKTCVPLITNNPYKAFILTLNMFHPKKISNGIISESAIISKHSNLGKNVQINDKVIIKENVNIGDNSIISSNTTINENVMISSNVFIDDNCSISNCSINDNCKIQSGSIIGSNGFGFAIDNNDYSDMEHLGKVIIGKNVMIGANTIIARGSLEDTIIGNNVRIDNLVHISHNVRIGDNSIIAAQSGIAGSTSIGKNVIMGGQVGISGHLLIGNNVRIAAKSGVIKNVKDNSIIGGYPAVKIIDWHRATVKLYLNKKNDIK